MLLTPAVRSTAEQTTATLERPIHPEISHGVWRLLGGLYPQWRRLDRRRERRYPYPQLVHLTPVAGEKPDPCGKSLVVVGKHLSESGLGFYHREPISHRRMIASLEGPDGEWLAFLLDLNWCRFTRHGWYESGGRFLATVPSPLAQQMAEASASSSAERSSSDL